MYGVNKFLFPNILWPWECTEYIHMAGSIQMDIVFQGFLGKVLLAMPNVTRNVGLLIISERVTYVIQNERSCCLMMRSGHQ